MDELKNIVASNLIELRVASGMTQSQLAEKINYSDKSVSKWERAEAIPDVAVLITSSRRMTVGKRNRKKKNGSSAAG